MMAAAGLDSIGAIVGFAVASGVGIASGNLIYSILSGPLQVRAPVHVEKVQWCLGWAWPSQTPLLNSSIVLCSVSALPP